MAADDDGNSQRDGRRRFGVAIPACDHIGRVADAANHAESLGFDSVWFPDGQLLWRDCLATMALASDRTSQVMIASGVTSTTTRHPTVVASAANTLRELAPGRVALGLGTGGLGHLLNMHAASRSQMRNDIAMIRALLDGRWWDFDGRCARLIDAGGQVPIYLAAGGPKLAALAGEIADGVIFAAGTTTDVIRASIDELRPGLEKSRRSLADLDVVLSVYFVPTEDLERAAWLFKPIACLLAKGAGRQYLESANIEIGDLDALPDIYPTIAHSQDWEAAANAAATVISDEAALQFARRFGLFGSSDEIARRVDEIYDAGVNHIFIRHVSSYEVPYAAMETFAQAVIARAPAA